MPKLLLIQPPVEDFYDTDIRLQPIGLAYLKAAVSKYVPEFSVTIRDYHQGWGRQTIALPKDLSYLRPYYGVSDRGPFSSFHQYFRFGADFNLIAEQVAAEQPDIVGISSLFTPYYREVLKLAAAIKKRCNAVVLVGGSHVSCAPETMISDPHVDFIIRGEGERPLVEFLQTWLANGDLDTVPNLGFKKSGAIHLNPLQDNYGIDQLKLPDLSDLPAERYQYMNQPVCMIVTSRGCPHSCAFCSVHRTFGKRYRQRQAEDVVQEMKERYDQGYRVFDFEDDNLTFDAQRFKELCGMIIDRFEGREIELLAMNGVSHKSLNKELLQLMQEAGFTHLNLALVSSDKDVLGAVQRPHRIEQFSKVVDEAHHLGLQVVAYQILGLPGELLDSMISSLVTLARHPLLIGVSTFYLTPGSPIAKRFQAMSKQELFRSRSTAMAITSEKCKRDDLYTLFITARILNFLKGLEFEGEEAEVMELIGKAESFSGRASTGLGILGSLLREGVLYGATAKGLKLLPRFDSYLFFRVWERIEVLVTQQGKKIIL